MMNMRAHKQAEQVLRLAKKSSLALPSDELAYQCRLASRRLHKDRLALNRLVCKSSLKAEDKTSEELYD